MRKIIRLKKTTGQGIGRMFDEMMKFVTQTNRRTLVKLELTARQAFPSKKFDRLILHFPNIPIVRGKVRRVK